MSDPYLARKRIWREANKEKIRGQKKVWRASNPEKVARHITNRVSTKEKLARKRELQRAWQLANPDKMRDYAERHRAKRLAHAKAVGRAQRLQKNYGLTLDQFAEMHERQGGKCAICKEPETKGRRGMLNVDHCHVRGVVRELLCNRCNRALGMFREDREVLLKAVAYLERHAG